MVMKPEPFFEAVDALAPPGPIVLMSARGRRFVPGRRQCGSRRCRSSRSSADTTRTSISASPDHLATESSRSVTSCSVAASLRRSRSVDATVRLLPGAMSDHASAFGDSFWERDLSAPSYTRPPEYRGHSVPEVLLSGDHGKIARWRFLEGERLTRERDLRERGGTDGPEL
jgi:tRNA (guanine37-N1)-methyltransferase